MKYKVGQKFIDSSTGYILKIFNTNEFREPSLAYGVDVYDGDHLISEGFTSQENLDKMEKIDNVQKL